MITFHVHIEHIATLPDGEHLDLGPGRWRRFRVVQSVTIEDATMFLRELLWIVHDDQLEKMRH